MVAAAISITADTTIHQNPKQAEAITPVSTAEAAQIAFAEVNHVLKLLEQLDGDDWNQPTDCTEWNVQDMTAHLAGACAGWASFKQFRRQTILNPYMRKMDVPIDAINRRQLEDRASKTPQALIDEFREVGPKAVRTRKNLPKLLRKIRMAKSPMPGKMSVAYLADVVYPRDQWIHRMDICRATGKTLTTTPEHDGRLLDLVMLDIAESLAGILAITVNVTGALTASYRFGTGEPQAELDIDYLALNRRASMRITAEEALQSVVIRGDQQIAKNFLETCPVLY